MCIPTTSSLSGLNSQAKSSSATTSDTGVSAYFYNSLGGSYLSGLISDIKNVLNRINLELACFIGCLRFGYYYFVYIYVLVKMLSWINSMAFYNWNNRLLSWTWIYILL
jgi:hypothetical protein